MIIMMLCQVGANISFLPVTKVTALNLILAWRAPSTGKRTYALSKTRMISKKSQHILKKEIKMEEK